MGGGTGPHVKSTKPVSSIHPFRSTSAKHQPFSLVSAMLMANSVEYCGLVRVASVMTDATRTKPQYSTLFAINMALTKENGWCFADVDLKGWMEETGFVDFTCGPVPPPMPHWLATARKPSAS